MLNRRPRRVDTVESQAFELEPTLAEERTRRQQPIESMHEETVVEEQRPLTYREVRHTTGDARLTARKARQAVWYFFGVVETLLALRFILLAVGANPANPFFNFLTGLTAPLAGPFASLVDTPRLGDSILELGTLFAMIIYLLLAIGIAKLLDLLLIRDA